MHDGGGGGHFGGGDIGGHGPHTGPDPGTHHTVPHHGHHSSDGPPWYATIGSGRPGRTRGMAGIAVIVAVVVIIALIVAI
jgi:hypothetical protein